MDPAHNLHDLLSVGLGERPRKVAPRLRARESDIAAQARAQIADLRRELKGAYHHIQGLNLERFVDIFRFAPGSEEQAALTVLERAITESARREVVVDTPPTALTLKMLALPELSLRWLEQLMSMRREILAKKRSVARVRREDPSAMREDAVLYRLVAMEERYTRLARLLKDREQTRIHIVLNEDELSLAESLAIRNRLKELQLVPADIWLNRAESSDCPARIKSAFPDLHCFCLPRQVPSPVGINALTSITRLLN